MSDGSGAAPPRVLGAALLHPLALTALLTLVVNDRLLKPRYPGLVTGKLSDLAGMLLFPLLLHALVEISLAPFGVRLERANGRRKAALACAALTAVTFGAIKTWEPATETFRVVLGALRCAPHALAAGSLPACRVHCVRDPSDLLALPLVLVAVWLLERAQLKSRPTSTPSTSPSRKSLRN